MRESSRALVVGGLLTGLMLAFFLFMAMPTVTGEEIRLPLQAVDPFDPLRGQSLTLSYAINNPAALPGLPTSLQEHQAVYVLLEESTTGLAVPVQASTSVLRAGKGQRLLRGHVDRGRIAYGIEALFIGRGAAPETSLAGAVARVQLHPDGSASVLGLLKDGKPITLRSRNRSL
ncbi:MAG: GDYXXLXY domain-containing protein [candidate division NC10 bacterium]|nr:GDYXXLXY domain-containing protein [candidate division NC10 bacterium]